MHLIIYIVLIVASCVAGACISTDEQTGEATDKSFPDDTGLNTNSEDLNIYRTGLKETLSEFYISTDIESKRNPELTDYIETADITPTIHQIIGTGVDKNGNADSWLLGIRYGDNESLIYREKTWWRENIWPGPLPEEEIDTEAIIMPGEIFLNNPEQTNILFENSKTGKTSVILIDGVYSVSTELSDGTEVIEFNAFTGEVIP